MDVEENGVVYRYTVKAKNTVGWGPQSEIVSAIPLGIDATLRTLSFSNSLGRYTSWR